MKLGTFSRSNKTREGSKVRKLYTLLVIPIMLLSWFSVVHADPTQNVSGTVLDAASNPVPNTRFYLVADSAGVDATFVTDSNGDYSIDVEPGFYHLILTNLQENASSTPGIPDQAALFNTDTTLDTTGGNVVQDVTLQTVGVTVTVRDASDTPIEGYTAQLIATGGGSTTLLDGNLSAQYTTTSGAVSKVGITDASGQVTLTVIKGLEYKVCAYDASNPTFCNPANLTPSGDTTVDVSTPPKHFISGTVKYADNAPVVGETVRVSLEDPNSGFTATALANSAGEYSIEAPVGVYTLATLIIHETNNPNLGDINITDAVSIDNTTSDQTQDFSLSTHTLTIHLEDSNSNPVAGATVYTRSLSESTQHTSLTSASNTATATQTGLYGTTDSSGNAVFVGLDNVDYQQACFYTEAGAIGCTSAPVTLDQDRTVSKHLPVFRTISGDVKDQNGNPIVGDQRVLVSVQNASAEINLSALADSNGHYSISVPADIYTGIGVSWQSTTPAAGDVFLSEDAVSLDTTSADVTGQDLVLTTHTITVHVQDAEGNPVEGATVNTRSTSSSQVSSLTSASNTASGYHVSLTGTTDSLGNATLIGIDNFEYQPICAYASFTSCENDIFTLDANRSITLSE
jgi:protocatechuate 3,4-dioxygenase beta subunit